MAQMRTVAVGGLGRPPSNGAPRPCSPHRAWGTGEEPREQTNGSYSTQYSQVQAQMKARLLSYENGMPKWRGASRPGSPNQPLPKDEILDAMLQQDAAGLRWILTNLAKERPSLNLRFEDRATFQFEEQPASLGQRDAFQARNWLGPAVELESETTSELPFLREVSDRDYVQDDRRPLLSTNGIRNVDDFQPAQDMSAVAKAQGSKTYLRERFQDGGRNPEEVHSVNEHLPSLLFASTEFYCVEGEGQVSLEVLRTGNKNLRTEVGFTTRDMNAGAGVNYVAQTDTLAFEPGQARAFIRIELIDHHTWNALMQFKVVLLPDQIVGGHLSSQNREARVNYICAAKFPSDRHKVLIEEGYAGVHKIPEVSLLLAYFRFTFIANHGIGNTRGYIRCNVVKRCMVDQLHNIHFLISQIVMVYLVDFVLDKESGRSDWTLGERDSRLAIIVSIELVCLLVVHIFDNARLGWSIGGPSRRTLQKGLLSQFLMAKEQADAPELTMLITRDAQDVAKGFSNMLRLVQAIGAFIMVVSFQVLSPLIYKRPIQEEALVPVLLFPMLLAFLMWCRTQRTVNSLHEKKVKESGIAAFVSQTVENRRLICDFGRRSYFVDHADQTITEYNAASRLCNKVFLNNHYIVPWITMVYFGAVIYFGGIKVLHGGMSLGMFLANLRVIQKLGSAMSDINGLILEIAESLPALQRIVIHLNRETDLLQRMRIEREGRTFTQSMREDLMGKCEGRALDRLPILLEDITLQYYDRGERESVQMKTLLEVKDRLMITQGHLVCLVGEHGRGKTTLLKFIGGALLPEGLSGTFFIPSHLRTLHVSHMPLFFEGTIMDNLCFGVNHASDGDIARVRRILERLEVDGEIDVLSEDTMLWQTRLTMATSHKLNLARALIANPHMLCVHKPTLVFHDSTCALILDLLREFVTQSGLELDPAFRSKRVPRTCVFTSNSLSYTDKAHCILRVTRKGIEVLGKTFLRDEIVGRRRQSTS